MITENMFTTKGIEGIAGLFGHDTFYGYFKDEGKLRLVSGGRYRPLTPAMFAFEYDLVGQKPWLSHFINAVCYGVLCFLLYGFLHAFFAFRLSGAVAMQIAFFASLVFALHPIHTEAVANIKGRDEIVAAIGAIGGLWMLLKSLTTKEVWWYRGMAALLFFIGLLSKENVITMLAAVPVTLLWTKTDKKINWVQTMLPIVAPSLIFLFIRGSVTGWSTGSAPKEMMNNPFIKLEDNVYKPFSFGEKTATVTYTMGKYVQLLLFPYPLTHDYYPRHIDIQTWGKPMVLLSLLVWLGLLYAVIRGWKTRSWWAYGILFYVITMSITSNLLFPVGTNMSERFAFLPSVGFALIAGYAVHLAMQTRYRNMVTILFLVYLGALGSWSFLRSQVWKDNSTLFKTDIKVSKRSAKLLNAVGGDLVTFSQYEKDEAKKKEMLTEAQGYLKRALEIHPNYKLSYLLLGNSYFHQGDLDNAIKYFRHVLKLDANYSEGRRNLGVALRDKGKIEGEQNRNLDGAIALLLEAAEYLPNDFQTFHLLGVAHGQKGDPNQAIEYFKKAIELAPTNASAHFNLGVAYRQFGDMGAAEFYFNKAKELDPDLPQFQRQE